MFGWSAAHLLLLLSNDTADYTVLYYTILYYTVI